MTLQNAHEGYEYQDLLTAYFILDEILRGNVSEFRIDHKQHQDDHFDDLTIIRNGEIFRKQIKYSNPENSHTLSKDDLAHQGSYDLAIHDLFASWISNQNDSELRLCLAWNEPTDQLSNVIVLSQSPQYSFDNHQTTIYSINPDAIWPLGQQPISSWRSFRRESPKINRDLFIRFCTCLTIEVNLPKFSLDILNPGELERIVLNQTSNIGIGEYPNEDKKPEETILLLAHKIKYLRARSEPINTKAILEYLKIRSDFGAIEQEFPIDQRINVVNCDIVDSIIEQLKHTQRLILLGEPGSGKSWLMNNLTEGCKEAGIKVIKHYCYTDLQDELFKERITLNKFYGNLISDIIGQFPELIEHKYKIFASNLNELNSLLRVIPQRTILIIDGLDHIGRIFNMHTHDIASSEIEIIKKIGQLDLGANVSCLVSTQPIVELSTLTDFVQTTIPTWNRKQICNLLKIHNIPDTHFEKELISLSDFLQNKSQGNVLYLTYLINEIQRIDTIEIEILNALPPYSINLSNYYGYLLSQLHKSENNPIVLALVGCNFLVTRNELEEITFQGSFVDDALKILSTILKQNISLGGYILYHESFRRFLIERLSNKQVDLKEAIRKPIINWLAKKDFFKYPKSYRFYLSLLYDSEMHDDVISYLKTDFLQTSLFNGHSFDAIRKNYYIFLKSITIRKSLSKLVLLNEFNRVLSSTESEYYDAFDLYFEALGRVRGFDVTVHYLTFDGKPAIDQSLGLRACYMCEDNGVAAPWNLYNDIFGKGKEIELHNFKSYLKYFLSINDIEALIDIGNQVHSRSLFDYMVIYNTELSRTENKLKNDIAFEVLKKIRIALEPDFLDGDILEVALSIKSIDHFRDGDRTKIENLFLLAKEAYLANQANIVRQIEEVFSENYWFQNWLVYSLRLEGIKLKTNATAFELIECFSLLSRNVEPFKGKPRTSDLYQLEGLIYNSISEGLALIDTTETWNSVINILIEVSNETTTSFHKSLMGPLSTEKLFLLLKEYFNDNNSSIILEKLSELLIDKQEYHLHSYLANYHLILSILLAKSGQTETAEIHLKQGVHYILGYTMRKDSTLMELISSIESLKLIDSSLAEKEILNLKELADSVIEHTDGKGTRHFPVEWYSKFLVISPDKALAYILNCLVKTVIDWRLEDDLQNLLIFINGRYPELELYIARTFPLNSEERFLNYQLTLIDSLKNESTGVLKRIELIRIASLVQNKKQDFFSTKFINRLDSISKSVDLEIDFSGEFIRAQKTNDETTPPIQMLSIAETELSYNNIDDFLSKNPIDEVGVGLLKTFLNSNGLFDENLKRVIKSLSKKEGKRYDDKELNTDQLFVDDSEASIYYWVCRFVYRSGGWFERLIHIDFFVTAYNHAPNKAVDFLFELLYNELDSPSYHYMMSANLLNASVKTKMQNEISLSIWNELKESISLRLPFKANTDWTNLLENSAQMSEEESLICILLTRLKNGTVVRFESTITSLYSYLFSQPEKYIKPLNWFISKKHNFVDLATSVVLQILHDYWSVNSDYVNHFKTALIGIYPTRYFSIDFIIEELFPELRTKKIIFELPVYENINREDYRIYLSMNIRHERLASLGINMNAIFTQYRKILNEKREEDMEIYYNRVYNVMSPNVYPTRYMSYALNTSLYNAIYESLDPTPNEVFEQLSFNLKFITSYVNSSFSRPMLELPQEQSKNVFSEFSVDQSENWIRIAHFEEQIIPEMTRKFPNAFKCYGGLSFQKLESTIPYSNYILDPEYVFSPEFCRLRVEPLVICSFIQNTMSLEDFRFLWLNPQIVSRMGLKISHAPNPICAFNNQNEPVLKFQKWKEKYLSDDDRLDHEIATLSGSELLIRKDYFKILCGYFNEAPRYYIYSQSH